MNRNQFLKLCLASLGAITLAKLSGGALTGKKPYPQLKEALFYRRSPDSLAG
ncbi:MAG: hypothetical protein HQL20_02585 [Candidatus Omnitrophica bacterium]|nr:hypothetical protein [Candidatus Omnitrophota bacterium]